MNKRKKSPNSFIEDIYWAVKQRNLWRVDQPWWWNEFSVRGSRKSDAIEAFCKHLRITKEEYEKRRKQGLVACKKFQFVELP